MNPQRSEARLRQSLHNIQHGNQGMTDTESQAATAFIERWERSGAAERSNHQLFISELCDLIGVPRPNPATPDNSQNAYIFERAVTFQHGDGKTSSGFIVFDEEPRRFYRIRAARE